MSGLLFGLTFAYTNPLLTNYLERLLALIFHTLYHLTGSLGWSTLLLSMIVNTLLLPLYLLGDKIQRREQAVQANLKPKLDEFRRTFSGTMFQMVQKTLYRQHNYHPIYSLRSSIGFIIQVPFFIAAYQFLKNLELLQNQSWGPIIDLSQPDNLLGFGNNLLPWLMTLFNLLAGLAYTAQNTQKDAVSNHQLQGIAFLFLVLLYNSPAALLIYWSFSNLYALIKNLFTGSYTQGKHYWIQLNYLCCKPIRAIWKALPNLAEYISAVLGLFLIARFKIQDSIDHDAQQALYWGKICWYSFTIIQIFRLLCSRKSGYLILIHIFIFLSPSLVLQIPLVQNELSSIEKSALPVLILVFSLLLAIPPRLWHSAPYLLLKNSTQQNINKNLIQLISSSFIALLGLILFNNSALLYTLPSQSLSEIDILIGQLWPTFISVLSIGTIGEILHLRYSHWPYKLGLKSGSYQSFRTALAIILNGLLLLAISNNFVLKYDYGVMISWVFGQPQKLIIPISTLLLTLAAILLLYFLWLMLLRRLQIFIPLLWILVASIWSGTIYYSYHLWQFKQNYNPSSNTSALSSSQNSPNHTTQHSIEKPEGIYSYSKKHTNVVIIMLDRFIGPYLQEIINLEPELAKTFTGFTWYKNTISPGPTTISGLTALLGGHEYTPQDRQYPFQPVLNLENPAQSSPLSANMRKQLQDYKDYSLRHFYTNWATIREISHYLEWMKEQAVYDNSLIILASDHGENVRLPHQFTQITQDSHYLETTSKDINKEYVRFMPLLLVKLPGANHEPLNTELTAHSNADIPSFASLALPKEKRRNPFTNKALKFQDPNSPRYSYKIGQNPNNQKKDRFDIEKTYRIDGPIWEPESWHELEDKP